VRKVNGFIELEAVRHSPKSHRSVWSVSEISYTFIVFTKGELELFERVTADDRTRSSVRGDLAVRRTTTKFGDWAFVVARPKAWTVCRLTSATLHQWTAWNLLRRHICLLFSVDDFVWFCLFSFLFHLLLFFSVLHVTSICMAMLVGLWVLYGALELGFSCYGTLELSNLLVALLLFLTLGRYMYIPEGV